MRERLSIPISEVVVGDRVLLTEGLVHPSLFFDVEYAEHFEDGGFHGEPWIKLSGTWTDGAVCVRSYHGENRQRIVSVLRG